MEPERLTHLVKSTSDKPGHYVLYFLQQAQRTHDNPALEHAVQIANVLDLPVVVFFSFFSGYPYANRRNLTFMLEGLREVRRDLAGRGIGFVFRIGEPLTTIRDYLDKSAAVVVDAGYLRLQRKWRKELFFLITANYPHVDLHQVETDTIIPIHLASPRLEYGAYTLRPKLLRLVSGFLAETPDLATRVPYRLSLDSDPFPEDITTFLAGFTFVGDVAQSTRYHGGYDQADKLLAEFIRKRLDAYLDANDPALDLGSKMSMYLHFGQISPREIYNRINRAPVAIEVKAAYLEQLLVRRELAWNYVYYNHGYDEFAHITEPWAYQTMYIHRADQRDYLYTVADYLSFRTHDRYFNAAMREMVNTGFMHNYMRMYWAKKIIEWSGTYEEAYAVIVTLNDTYFLDGRDPSSYAGIAWCFGKHDRPWSERPIFGKLRSMTAAGLERKFQIEDYVSKWE